MQALRVLIVDDLRDAADTLALLISMWGHEVVVAYDAIGALEEAAAHPPDVVLLDLDMPQMNGFDLAGRLRQSSETANALLVAITGYGREEDVKRCQEAGMNSHFLKPVDPVELRRVLAFWRPSRGISLVSAEVGPRPDSP